MKATFYIKPKPKLFVDRATRIQLRTLMCFCIIALNSIKLKKYDTLLDLN